MRKSPSADFVRLLDSVPITTYEREIIKARYVSILDDADSEYIMAAIGYYILNNIVSVSGAVIAALVPITQSENVSRDVSVALYWVAFALAVVLTIANKWLLLFNINSNYIVGQAIVEKYKSEGWMFLSGVGRYRKPDWSERVSILCARVEKIKIVAQGTNSTNPVNDILSAGPVQDLPARDDNID